MAAVTGGTAALRSLIVLATAAGLMTPAKAQVPDVRCADDMQLFMACAIEGRNRVVSLCHDAQLVHYRYGAPGAVPELELIRAYGAGAEAIPWPGIGNSLWDGVRLTRGAVTYEIHAGVERGADNPPAPAFGAVVVLQDGKGEIARLDCRPGSVFYRF